MDSSAGQDTEDSEKRNKKYRLLSTFEKGERLRLDIIRYPLDKGLARCILQSLSMVHIYIHT